MARRSIYQPVKGYHQFQRRILNEIYKREEHENESLVVNIIGIRNNSNVLWSLGNVKIPMEEPMKDHLGKLENGEKYFYKHWEIDLDKSLRLIVFNGL